MICLAVTYLVKPGTEAETVERLRLLTTATRAERWLPVLPGPPIGRRSASLLPVRAVRRPGRARSPPGLGPLRRACSLWPLGGRREPEPGVLRPVDRLMGVAPGDELEDLVKSRVRAGDPARSRRPESRPAASGDSRPPSTRARRPPAGASGFPPTPSTHRSGRSRETASHLGPPDLPRRRVDRLIAERDGDPEPDRIPLREPRNPSGGKPPRPRARPRARTRGRTAAKPPPDRPDRGFWPRRSPGPGPRPGAPGTPGGAGDRPR